MSKTIFFKYLLYVGLLCQLLNAQNTSTQKLLIRGDLVIEGEATTNVFTCPNVILLDRLTANSEVKAAKLKSTKGMTRKLYVQTLIPTTGTLDIHADLMMTDPVSTETLEAPSTQFLSVNSWQLNKHEDFEAGTSAQGWSFAEISSCEGNKVYPNKFLGGPCKLSSKETMKEFTDLPEHSHLKITAKYHMFDQWQGEYGYMKVNNQIVWTKNGLSNNNSGSINICGSDHADPAYNVPVEITIPHTDDKIMVVFGSSLKTDPCVASYAVDDIMIYVK